MYATLGVAVATLVVVGGILAGPTILECSRDAGGFGNCLRDKLGDHSLKSPDLPSEPTQPAGWMEAVANEYEPPISVPVDLAGSPANLAAAETVQDAATPIAVAVAPAAEIATEALAGPGDIATVEIKGPTAALIAEGALSSEGPPADVALLGSDGRMAAIAPLAETPVERAAALTPPRELPPGTLTVLAPPAVEPVPVELRADVDVAPAPVPPTVVIEFNPEYPNVLVLPPPLEGDNSSFRSLQLN